MYMQLPCIVSIIEYDVLEVFDLYKEIENLSLFLLIHLFHLLTLFLG